MPQFYVVGREVFMEIHLVSSMDSDDESRLAPAMLSAIGRVLDRLPISYSLRIQTAAGNEIHHHHLPSRSDDARQADRTAQVTADIVHLFPASKP